MIARRKFLWIAVLAGVAGIAAQSGAFAAETVHIKLATTTRQIFDNLPLYVAEHGGQFAKHGLSVELFFFHGGGEVVRAVPSGTVDLGVVATTAGILAIGAGQKLKIISGWTAPSFGVVYAVKPDSPIHSIKDLVGKTVGFSRPGSVSHTALIAALVANGIQNQTTIIPVGSPGDSLVAIETGRVQASWLVAPRVYGLVDEKKVRILFGASEYLSDYQQSAFIATDAWLAKNGDTARKLLAALADAVKFTEQNPTQAAALGAKDLGATQKEIIDTLKATPKNWWRVGAPNPKDLAGSEKEAAGTGSLKEAPSYDQMVDKRFLP
jgi:ABC-type nitrate/sulfonate/bicarbonate transport system substrate-binding protein